MESFSPKFFFLVWVCSLIYWRISILDSRIYIISFYSSFFIFIIALLRFIFKILA